MGPVPSWGNEFCLGGTLQMEVRYPSSTVFPVQIRTDVNLMAYRGPSNDDDEKCMATNGAAR